MSVRLQAGILLAYFPLLIDYYPAYVPFSQALVGGTPREDHKLQEAGGENLKGRGKRPEVLRETKDSLARTTFNQF